MQVKVLYDLVFAQVIMELRMREALSTAGKRGISYRGCPAHEKGQDIF